MSANTTALFIVSKTIRIILSINPIFRAPKSPPSSLFNKPKAAKLTSLVRAFPARAMAITIITKVKT